MNSTSHSRKCRHCGAAFQPDYRNLYHQRFCSKLKCQRASKLASQRRWLKKAENRAYYCDEAHVKRVQDWRKAHPGYWKGCRCTNKSTLQEDWPAKTAGKSGLFSISSHGDPGTLQDVCRQPIPLLLGLIAQVGHCTLQEELAACVQEMVNKGQCILDQSSQRPAEQAGARYRQTDLFVIEAYETRRDSSVVAAGDRPVYQVPAQRPAGDGDPESPETG